MRLALAILLVCGVTACSSDPNEDLDQFIKNSGQGLRGKVEPLPEVKPYEPFTYEAFDLPDPFKPRTLKPTGGGGKQPDLDRPKEALESYPLENLKMVGTLEQGKTIYAVVKTPDNSLYRIRAGNHMGQNFGVVTRITDTEIHIKEIAQDSAGDWTERDASIQLQEEQEQKK